MHEIFHSKVVQNAFFNWTLCIAYFVLNVKRLSWCFSRAWNACWAQNQFTDIHKNAHTISLKNSITFLIWPRHSIHLHDEICDKLWGTNEWKSAVCLFVITALIKIWTCARKQVICDSFGSGMVSVHWNHWTTATYGLKVWYLAHSFHFNGEYIFDLKHSLQRLFWYRLTLDRDGRNILS